MPHCRSRPPDFAFPRPCRRPRWLGLGVASLLPFVAAAGLAGLQAPPKSALPADANPGEEAYIHTPVGFNRSGKPASAGGGRTGTLRLTVVDEATGKPTFARVNVVGADGNYYEPKDHLLAPWSLHRAGNRPGKGPFRYYGWFFYCPGEAVVTVPEGLVRVEVWKGYEFRPARLSTRVPAGGMEALTVRLRRTLPMSAHSYYSGDSHIHLERRTPVDDDRALDLLAAEDVGTGYILCFNDTNAYTGIMSRQTMPQERGFGAGSIKSRGGYTIVSGQEYRAATYGHICLIMHRRPVLHEQTVDPRNWPTFGMVGQETRQLGGYSFHAHGGYAKEIYVDFARRLTDGVELLQFAEYRGIGLHGWYRMLNAGFRFPGVGACDYPYCRALADCRTYVRAAARPDPSGWARLAAEGRGFFTTGPMLLLEADGRHPGDSLFKAGPGPQRVKVRVKVRCEVAPVTNLELIVNGVAKHRRQVPPDSRTGRWFDMSETVELSESSWIAARAFSVSPTGKPDAEAHTNPVYVYMNGKAPYRREDLDWLLARVEDQITEVNARRFAEKPRVLEFFRKSREELLAIRGMGGLKTPAGLDD